MELKVFLSDQTLTYLSPQPASHHEIGDASQAIGGNKHCGVTVANLGKIKF